MEMSKSLVMVSRGLNIYQIVEGYVEQGFGYIDRDLDDIFELRVGIMLMGQVK